MLDPDRLRLKRRGPSRRHPPRGALPGLYGGREGHHNGALLGPDLGALDLSLSDDQLLPKQGVHCQQLTTGAAEIEDEAEEEALAQPEELYGGSAGGRRARLEIRRLSAFGMGGDGAAPVGRHKLVRDGKINNPAAEQRCLQASQSARGDTDRASR